MRTAMQVLPSVLCYLDSRHQLALTRTIDALSAVELVAPICNRLHHVVVLPLALHCAVCVTGRISPHRPLALRARMSQHRRTRQRLLQCVDRALLFGSPLPTTVVCYLDQWIHRVAYQHDAELLRVCDLLCSAVLTSSSSVYTRWCRASTSESLRSTAGSARLVAACGVIASFWTRAVHLAGRVDGRV